MCAINKGARDKKWLVCNGVAKDKGIVLRFKAICSAYHFDDSLIGATTDNPSVIEYQIVKTVGSNVQVGFSKATDSILML